MKVTLPWPDRRLSPNARAHWAVIASVKAKAKRDAAYLAYEAMGAGVRDFRQCFAGDGPIAYQVTFYPPDARHRDDDNMIGSLKAARDGLAEALGVNDRRFRPEYYFAEPCKPGRIEVKLSPIRPHKQAVEFTENQDSATQKSGPDGARTPPSRDPDAEKERIG